jgi:hypothetical protein
MQNLDDAQEKGCGQQSRRNWDEFPLGTPLPTTIFPDQTVETVEVLPIEDSNNRPIRMVYFAGCIIYSLPDGSMHTTNFAYRVYDRRDFLGALPADRTQVPAKELSLEPVRIPQLFAAD